MAYKSTPQLDQVYLLAAAWVETLCYGFYLCLISLAMYLVYKQPRTPTSPNTSSAGPKIFLVGMIVMFLNASVHEFIVVCRVMRAYGWNLGPDGTPVSYFRRDNYAHAVLTGVMTWTADALVIYHCYIIWGSNFNVIILPIILAVATMTVNVTLYIWWGNQATSPLVDTCYPLLFTQNVVTTGLIIWRIVRQHHKSKAAGLVVMSNSNSTSLMTVAKILVESALLYTFTLLLVIILYFIGHPLQFVVRAAIIPSIGIVFLLIAVRVHIARKWGPEDDVAVPSWVMNSRPVLDNSESTSESENTDDPATWRYKPTGPR